MRSTAGRGSQPPIDRLRIVQHLEQDGPPAGAVRRKDGFEIEGTIGRCCNHAGLLPWVARRRDTAGATGA